MMLQLRRKDRKYLDKMGINCDRFQGTWLNWEHVKHPLVIMIGSIGRKVLQFFGLFPDVAGRVVVTHYSTKKVYKACWML